MLITDNYGSRMFSMNMCDYHPNFLGHAGVQKSACKYFFETSNYFVCWIPMCFPHKVKQIIQ